ncbi:MAG: hypothetical protein ACPGPF_01755 [Pontibacterium sp.]
MTKPTYLRLTDTRGIEHSFNVLDVESFAPSFCPLGNPCIEVIVAGELVYADCSLFDFARTWGAACEHSEAMLKATIAADDSALSSLRALPIVDHPDQL